MKHQDLNHKSGFTLIEVVIAIVIVGIVSVVGFISFFRYQGAKNLEFTTNEIVSMIRETQKKSITQQDGKRWGIRFENAENGDQKIYTFNGNGFGLGSTTQTSSLRRGVLFGSPHPSSTYDLLFTPIEGALDQNKIITLRTNNPIDPIMDIIVNMIGKITVNTELGLIGYWHFDEESGTITYDSSGRGHNGTLSEVQPPVWDSTECVAGSCLVFSGDQSFVTILPSSDFLFAGDFTISFWIQTGEERQNMIAFMIGNEEVKDNLNFLFNDSKTGNGITVFWEGYQDGDFKISGSSWSQYTNGPKHFVTLRRLGGELNLFVDANFIDKFGGYDRAIGSATNNVLISSGINEKGWVGILDEIRVYNRGLSADEIKTMYEELK